MQPDLLWVAIFALSGVAMGLVTSLAGLRKGWDVYGWILIYAVMIAGISLMGVASPFWTTFIGSIAAGLAAGLVQASLRPWYIQNNPWYRPERRSATRATATFIVFGLLMGVLVGLMAGGIAALVRLLQSG